MKHIKIAKWTVAQRASVSVHEAFTSVGTASRLAHGQPVSTIAQHNLDQSRKLKAFVQALRNKALHKIALVSDRPLNVQSVPAIQPTVVNVERHLTSAVLP